MPMTETNDTHGPRAHTPIDLTDGPILASVRQIKQEISSRYDHDVSRLFSRLRELRATSGRHYVDHRTQKSSVLA